MQRRLTPGTAVLLTIPPFLWASNAVVGHMVRDMASPMALNLVRWVLAFAMLLPLAHSALRRDSPLWPHWKRYSTLGLFGVCLYNGFQYLALQTSTPLNVALVGASMPVWMLATGALFFGARATQPNIVGALCSVLGVLLVLGRGKLDVLTDLNLVVGDLYMMVAAIAWSFYSWQLVKPDRPAVLRGDWAAFLLAQVLFGMLWSCATVLGEWAVSTVHMDVSLPMMAALVFIAAGPAVMAFRCWGAGVERAGPQTAAFFMNLTPLFAAVLSLAFLSEMPRWYHGVAFLLIVGGIVVSSRSSSASVS